MKSRAKAEKIPRPNKSFNKFRHSCREQLRVVKPPLKREKVGSRQTDKTNGDPLFSYFKVAIELEENKGSGTVSVNSLKIESLVAIEKLALYSAGRCVSLFSCYVAP